MAAPGAVQFEPDEIDWINRVRVAEKLGKFPHEVDDAPALDIAYCIAVWDADAKYRDSLER